MVESEGAATFAELAMIPILKQHGFDGAVWVDNYRSCYFRDAFPPKVCTLPEHICSIHARIVNLNGGRGGCWDVLAWRPDGIMFVECKQQGTSDRIRPNQKKWLESARTAGLRPESFAICEWILES